MLDQNQVSKKNKVNKIQFNNDSYIRDQKRIKLNKKQTHKGDALNTDKYGKEGVFTRNIGGIGNKINTRTRHERSGETNNINDAVMVR